MRLRSVKNLPQYGPGARYSADVYNLFSLGGFADRYRVLAATGVFPFLFLADAKVTSGPLVRT